MTEIDLLEKLARYSEVAEIRTQYLDLLWLIVVNSKPYKLDIIDACIEKFCDMTS